MNKRGMSQNVRVILLLLGISFYLLWLIAGIFSSLVWYGDAASFDTLNAWPLTLALNAAVLVVLALLAKRISPVVQKTPLIIASACVTAAGIALVTIAYNIPGYHGLLLPGCILTGAGSAPLVLCWRECSEGLASKRVQRRLFAFAVILDTVFYLLLVSLPFVVTLVICMLSPICSAILFVYAYDPTASRGEIRATQPATQPIQPLGGKLLGRNRDRSLGMLLVCCLLLSFGQGVLRNGFPSVDIQLTWTLVVSSVVLVIVGVVFIDLYLMKRFAENRLFRLFFPVVVIAFLSAPYFVYRQMLLTQFFVFAGSFLLMIFAYSEIDAARGKGYLPIQVFALGVISLDVGGILGTAFRHKFASALPMALVGVIYAAVCLGVCVYRELARSDSEDERFAPRQGADADRLFVAPIAPKMSMVDSISRQCHETARQYALSSREEEVLAYLVRGKSAKSIAHSTYISYNTIKTHMSHIYHKMGIHSREEMIQIVESVNLEE